MASGVRWRLSRRRFIGAGTGFSAAFLAACSGSSNGNNQGKQSGSTGAAATAAPVTQVAVTAQPQAGRALNRNAKITLPSHLRVTVPRRPPPA
jgi:hypothetical protein